MTHPITDDELAWAAVEAQQGRASTDTTLRLIERLKAAEARADSLAADVLRLNRDITEERARSEALSRQLDKADQSLIEERQLHLRRNNELTQRLSAEAGRVAELEARIDAEKARVAELEAATTWRSPATAPLETPVIVRTRGRRVFLARQRFVLSGYVYRWAAEKEGLHPDCWSDGECWTVNADNEPSDPVAAWMPFERPEPSSDPGQLPAAPQTEEGGE